MKATELAASAVDIAKNYKTLYVMGCFGAPMTDANKTRYIQAQAYNQSAARQGYIKTAAADTFGFDCVCLIKGILWGWSGNTKATYGGAAYTNNGVPDINADQMIAKCADVSTDFSDINKIAVGEVVWLPGHIGIYVGGGLVVECSPAWANCVQFSSLGKIPGYNSRKWTKHGKLPYVEYDSVASMVATPAATATGDAAIWNFLKNKGLNDCAVAGVMGNLFAESGLNPKNLQNTYEKSLGYTDDGYTAAVDSGKYTNFVKDSAGYGLAQWTYWSRKQGLLDAAKAAKTSIGDLTTQLNYLWKELQSYGLISALSSSTTVLSASNVILLQFEKPADQSAAAQTKRASYGQGYYTKFAGKSGAVAAPTSYPQISKGATGEIVKILQNALNSKYGYKLAIDGSFGPATDAAVRNLQKSFGLAVDGVVGKNTWGKLVDV